VFLIIRAVASERGDGTVDLIEQVADLRAVTVLYGSGYRHSNPSLLTLLH
jgi:hypothetical protein